MEMTRGTTLRKTEKRLGERRSGQQPELGEGEEAWKGAAEKMKVGLVKQGESKRNKVKTMERVRKELFHKKRDSGAVKRAKRGDSGALARKVEAEKEAMQGGDQVAVASSTPKPERPKEKKGWEKPAQRPHQRPQQQQHHQPQHHQPQQHQQQQYHQQQRQQFHQLQHHQQQWQQNHWQHHQRGNQCPQQQQHHRPQYQQQQQHQRQHHQPQQRQQHQPKSVVVAPTSQAENKGSDLVIEKGTEKGAKRKAYVGS